MKTNLLNAVALAIVMMTCYNCSVEPLDNVPTTSLITNSVSITAIPETMVSEEHLATTGCDGTDSRIRIANNGTFASHYGIHTMDGVLIASVDNILPGTISEWLVFPEGTIIVNVTIDSQSDQKVVYQMDSCMELTMEIDLNNRLTNAQPQAISN